MPVQPYAQVLAVQIAHHDSMPQIRPIGMVPVTPAWKAKAEAL